MTSLHRAAIANSFKQNANRIYQSGSFTLRGPRRSPDTPRITIIITSSTLADFEAYHYELLAHIRKYAILHMISSKKEAIKNIRYENNDFQHGWSDYFRAVIIVDSGLVAEDPCDDETLDLMEDLKMCVGLGGLLIFGMEFAMGRKKKGSEKEVFTNIRASFWTQCFGLDWSIEEAACQTTSYKRNPECTLPPLYRQRPLQEFPQEYRSRGRPAIVSEESEKIYKAVRKRTDGSPIWTLAGEDQAVTAVRAVIGKGQLVYLGDRENVVLLPFLGIPQMPVQESEYTCIQDEYTSKQITTKRTRKEDEEAFDRYFRRRARKLRGDDTSPLAKKQKFMSAS